MSGKEERKQNEDKHKENTVIVQWGREKVNGNNSLRRKKAVGRGKQAVNQAGQDDSCGFGNGTNQTERKVGNVLSDIT